MTSFVELPPPPPLVCWARAHQEWGLRPRSHSLRWSALTKTRSSGAVLRWVRTVKVVQEVDFWTAPEDHLPRWSWGAGLIKSGLERSNVQSLQCERKAYFKRKWASDLWCETCSTVHTVCIPRAKKIDLLTWAAIATRPLWLVERFEP